jgi:hypothetical protein
MRAKTDESLLLPLYYCLFTTASLLLPLYYCIFTTASLLLHLYYCLLTTHATVYCREKFVLFREGMRAKTEESDERCRYADAC